MFSLLSFLKQKQYRIVILINVVFALILLAYLNYFGNIAHRNTVYVFIAPFFLLILFMSKNILVKITLPIFFLIFIENIFISAIPVAKMFRVGGAMIFALTAIISIIYHQKSDKLPRLMAVQWVLYFTAVLMSFVLGASVSENLLNENVEALFLYYIEFLLYFYLGYLAFNDIDMMKKFLFIIILMGLLSAAGHIFSMLTGINLESARGVEAVASTRDLSQGRWRYGGFFGNVNTMSAFYVMLVPASFYIAVTDRSYVKKAISLITIIAMIISVLLGASRGGLLFILVNLLISLLFIRIKIKNVVFSLIAISILIYVLNMLLDQFFMDYLTRAINEMVRKGTDSPREQIWYYTWLIILEHPFGLGLSTTNYYTVLQQYGNLFWANPHNMYLEQITQAGFAGLFFFLSIVIRILYRSVKSFKNSENPAVKEIIPITAVMIIGFLLMGFTEPIFRNQYKLNHLFAIILGISLSVTFRITNMGLQKKEEQKII